jgi:threonyl-tRNA synthetase
MQIIEECIYSEKELKTKNFSNDDLLAIQKDVSESINSLFKFYSTLKKVRKERLK